MIGLAYLFLCFALGSVICSFAFPRLDTLVKTDYYGRKISVSPYIILLPSWFLIGTLALTWATYLTAYLFRETSQPLFYANVIIMPMALTVIGFALILTRDKKKISRAGFICKDGKAAIIEAFLLAVVTLLACILMWITFFIKGNQLYIGATVFSDFSPHIGMIQSFASGNNFPTTYPHFAGEDIKYHFMFQFLAGNLKFLGLRLDYAFNIPSIISFISAFLLLYLLAVKITGKIGAGILACLFFSFRSSKTLFTYILELPKGVSILGALNENTSFLGYTPNEEWGLWNLNVYCNQRHLALGLATIFLIILLFLPHLYETFEILRQVNHAELENYAEFEKFDGTEYHIEQVHNTEINNDPRFYHKNSPQSFQGRVLNRIRIIFFTKEGWEVKDLRSSVAAGILLGSLSFFHGAAVIGCLSVLFVMAIASRRRLEYLITAVITIIMSLLQTKFFIHGSVVATKFFFGFISEDKTILGVASYLERLLGILPFVLLAAFILEKKADRYLMIAFTTPLVFAFTVSLTIDVTVNHKYIMISCILLGIFAAAFVMKLLDRKNILFGIIGIVLIISLTATGVYDFITVLKRNTPQTSVVLTMDDPLTQWIDKNSDSQDLFLTSNYTVNQIVLGGAMLYEGWDYYPWSAGYDTYFRTEQVKKMYEAETPSELVLLVEKNKIRFIVVDKSNRESTDYVLNEENIEETYECVYQEGEDISRTSIYDTKKPVQW